MFIIVNSGISGDQSGGFPVRVADHFAISATGRKVLREGFNLMCCSHNSFSEKRVLQRLLPNQAFFPTIRLILESPRYSGMGAIREKVTSSVVQSAYGLNNLVFWGKRAAREQTAQFGET
jgi:hypothetical protein